MIEIAELILKKTRRVAACGAMLRELVERGLRQVLGARRDAVAFRLRKASFAGAGLQPGFQDGDWRRIRDAAYEGRGG